MFDIVNWDKQLLLSNPEILEDVYNELRNLCVEYPDFSFWYWNIMRPGLWRGERRILCAHEEKRIAGIMILKSGEEKKICTLRVKEEFRGQGLGRLFVQHAQFFLKCKAPLVTVPGKHFEEFHSLFTKTGFVLRGKYPDYYTMGSDEFAYNGLLEMVEKREMI